LLACQSTIFEGLASRDSSSLFTRAAWPSKLRRAHRDGVLRAKALARFGRWDVPRATTAHDVESAVRSTVINLLPLTCEAVANAHAALETLGARLLVVGNDLTLEGRAGCRVARLQGIPTATFMHGNITGDPLQARHSVDRILVFGNIHRDELVQRGYPRERIVVCGAPSMDARPRQTGRTNAQLCQRLGLQAGKPWILVTTSGPGHRISLAHHLTVVQELARLSAAMPTVPLVVKLHRKDRPEHYQKALQSAAGRNMIVVAENTPGYPADIFEWLGGCPVVLTGASTVAVEAMLMDVPVVTMDFADEVQGVDFIEAGATRHVRTGEALVEAVTEILSGHAPAADAQSRVRAYLEEAFCSLDGRSASRAVGSLIEQIQQGAPQ
jgi:UDP-N-acetylglucosamine 2-epimerase